MNSILIVVGGLCIVLSTIYIANKNRTILLMYEETKTYYYNMQKKLEQIESNSIHIEEIAKNLKMNGEDLTQIDDMPVKITIEEDFKTSNDPMTTELTNPIKSVPTNDIDEIKRLFNEGYSVAEIARNFKKGIREIEIMLRVNKH